MQIPFFAASFVTARIAFASLFLLAADASAAAGKQYAITEHGAIGDGTTVNTKSLQSLIDQCAAEGAT